jgi:hypothetical protein
MHDQQIIIAAYGLEKRIAPTEEIRLLELDLQSIGDEYGLEV